MNPNDYDKQQIRAWSRKLELVKLMGGCCSKCGYKDNIAALEFHHINPEEKSFQLDSRHLSNTSMIKFWKNHTNVFYYVLIVIEKYIILNKHWSCY